MAVNLGDKPLAGFGQPIELLTDCHRRIEHFLGVLRTVVQRFGEGDLTAEGRRALAASLHYFTNSAPLHTADEEQSLFPRLRRRGDAEARALMAELDRLEQDHRRIEAWHAQVEKLVRPWLETGRIDRANRAILAGLLDALAVVYAEHIRFEEDDLFALAIRLLQAEQLREMGEEMKQRRGLDDSGQARSAAGHELHRKMQVRKAFER